MRLEEGPGYKGVFAKPTSLNPSAMAQIDPQNR